MSPDGALREITLPFADPTGQAASLLEAALASSTHPTEVEKLLRQHLLTDPDYLPAYFAMYKLLFRQSRLAEAEEIARTALASGARLGGFPPQLAAPRSRHGRLVRDSQSCPFLSLHPEGPEFHPVTPQSTGRMPGGSGKVRRTGPSRSGRGLRHPRLCRWPDGALSQMMCHSR